MDQTSTIAKIHFLPDSELRCLLYSGQETNPDPGVVTTESTPSRSRSSTALRYSNPESRGIEQKYMPAQSLKEGVKKQNGIERKIQTYQTDNAGTAILQQHNQLNLSILDLEHPAIFERFHQCSLRIKTL
ncbi:hypothetical protein CBL_03277 [Carabus blaptoides fortunei]